MKFSAIEAKKCQGMRDSKREDLVGAVNIHQMEGSDSWVLIFIGDLSS
jgi:hypothetical protein